MLRVPFPEHADTDKLFARNGSISAVLPLVRLQRVVASLADSSLAATTEVLVDLEFGHDDEGRRRLRGELKTSVMQLCQRCLSPMQQELECFLDLLVLNSEQELKALPEAAAAAQDAIVDETGELDLLGLVEDELLLSLPLVSRHEDANCSEVLNELRRKDRDLIASKNDKGKRPSPFDVLAVLKLDKTNGSTD